VVRVCGESLGLCAPYLALAHSASFHPWEKTARSNPGILGQTPTRFQADTYPDWAQSKLRIVPEGVDLYLCRPDPEAAFRRGKRA
jgi:hypothetical protein